VDSTPLNSSESGIGRFSRELRLAFRPAVTKGQPAGKEESPNMYQSIQLKKATPLFLVLSVLAGFAFLPQMHAAAGAP